MSGDVQPRKRNKDKKRRREDSDVSRASFDSFRKLSMKNDEDIRPSGVNTTKMGPEDIQLHVHSDHDTGGHWCAKVLFFSLLAILLGLIGIILLENRGISDLDTPLSESRFAEVLEGWVDEKRETHDDHEDEHTHLEDSHEDEGFEDDHNLDDDADEDDEHADGKEEHADGEEMNADDETECSGSEDNADIDEYLSSKTNDLLNGNSNSKIIERKQSERAINTNSNIDTFSAEQLKEQVDDLVINYNILAKKLNRPLLNEMDDDEMLNELDDNDQTDDDPINIDADSEKKEDQNDGDDDIENSDDERSDEVAVDDDGNEIELDDDSDDDHDGNDQDNDTSQADQSGESQEMNEKDLKRANELLDEDPKFALTIFEQILENHPASSMAQFGLAKSLDRLAELNRSNDMLKRAIFEYEKYIIMNNINDNNLKWAAERCIDRIRFSGEHMRAIAIYEKLIERFSDDPYYRNQLAVTYLLVDKLAEAKYVLHRTLEKWRDDGFAAVHYGYVLKNLDGNLEMAIIFLRQGIESGAQGTDDGRFYFHLGDALSRLGRTDEAKQVFRIAAEKNHFPSEYQRSLYNVDNLKAQPFWSIPETGYKREFRMLEENWKKIRDEGLSVLELNGYFIDEAENLRDKGIWKQFEIFARGKRNANNCVRTPYTCKLIETFPAARFCKRGQVKFSVIHPNTHVWPHCGPTNCRLRAHLPLKMANKTSIRVATETRTWEEGKIMIFDDSFEHEVWHNGTTSRLILIIDVWHPDLTSEQKKSLLPI